MKIARILTLLLSFVSAHPTLAAPYIAVDMATGRVLAHNQAFDRWYPASLTKMMTAYVAFRALQTGDITLQTPVLVSANAAKVPPSRSGYKPGSTLQLDTALTILLVRSANDIAVAIGEMVSGSEAAFIARMNAEAQRLGMIGTHFANTNGLPSTRNYSTARDMAVLATQIRREFPQYAHFFKIQAIDFGQNKRVQQNSNNLIGRFSGADGMKTGFICSSGFNLASSATRDGRTIIAVVLGADRIDQREALSAQLLTDGFKNDGSSQVTLATLRPYGTKLAQATDMREQICTEEAWKARAQFRDEKGNTIFNSPFISVLRDKPAVMPVRLLAPPPRLKRGELPIWKIPVPAPRPETY
ncbi:MAG: Penicillin-binding protein [Candidatus Tokpelaia hoelldobleri]|uniref:Penicillin-binding protein n=1 Tax=Candidatus Tokpelaia hoelldobleri TaxID=1902579 RepID=A0A1U9JSC1_9HYPH|nr:MAG: Penicillin-binding protein [Candidatus Tokpelaia hoelldoblerii]